jgi:hypothetical protein
VVIHNGVDTELFKLLDKNESIQNTNLDPLKKNILFVSDPLRAEKNYLPVIPMVPMTSPMVQVPESQEKNQNPTPVPNTPAPAATTSGHDPPSASSASIASPNSSKTNN